MSRAAPSSRNGATALSRDGTLDLLRFMAAMFIVLYHVAERAPLPLFAVHPAFSRGYLATDFFLMLSGYVLARTYGPRVLAGGVGTLDFLKRRVLRIWPAHLVVLVAFVGFYLATRAVGLEPQNPQWFQWSQLWPQVFLVQAWFIPGPSGWNIPTWTLSALIVCYALFPLAWRWVSRVRSPWKALAVGLVAYLAIDLAARVTIGLPGYQLPLRFGLIRGVPLFMIGLLIARIGETVVLNGRWADTLSIGAAVGVVALQALGRFDHLSLALLGLLILTAGASPAKGWRWAGAAGRLSFPLFLTNQLVAVVWFGVARLLANKLNLDTPALWLIWAMALPACLLVAWLFERLVDAPLQGWVKSLPDSRARARQSGGAREVDAVQAG